MRIVFMGTPDFALASLKSLVENNYNVVGVVTVADKPAGRGQKLHASPVKQYAEGKGIPVLQPVKLKDEEFLHQLRALKPDLQIVVAFRMLPEVVWRLPKYGTFNLHASLLPNYRGAAPINWAIINGEKQTGVTTFFIDEKIDTGAIIQQAVTPIEAHETAGSLHDKLMEQGAALVLQTDQLGFRLPWRINGFSVNGKWTVVGRKRVVVGEIIDDFFNPNSIFGRLLAAGQESADVGVAPGINIYAECRYRLLGNGFDWLVGLFLVAFGVFCKRQIFFSNGGSRQCCVGWTLKTFR